MSKLYWKFNNAKHDFNTITFEGPVISILDLKRAIVAQKKLEPREGQKRKQNFDLVITNAQTGEEYNRDDYLLNRNTSVRVKRVPATSFQMDRILMSPDVNLLPEGAVVPPKSAVESEFGPAIYDPQAAKKRREQAVAKRVDEDRARMIEIMQEKEGQNGGRFNYGTRPSGPLPPGYICHRCNQAGHWKHMCPTLRDRNWKRPKATIWGGAPLEQPGKANEMDKQIVIIGGKPVLVNRKTETRDAPQGAEGWQVDAENSAEKKKRESRIKVPDNLCCRICNECFTQPVSVPCCSTTFCNSCIRQKLYLEEGFECPVCSSSVVPDKLKSNHGIQKLCSEWHEKRKLLEQQEKETESRKRRRSRSRSRSRGERGYTRRRSHSPGGRAVKRETRSPRVPVRINPRQMGPRLKRPLQPRLKEPNILRGLLNDVKQQNAVVVNPFKSLVGLKTHRAETFLKAASLLAKRSNRSKKDKKRKKHRKKKKRKRRKRRRSSSSSSSDSGKSSKSASPDPNYDPFAEEAKEAAPVDLTNIPPPEHATKEEAIDLT